MKSFASPESKVRSHLLIAAVLATLATSAEAETLFVPNFSFEDAGSISSSPANFSTAAPGWVFNVFTPTDAYGTSTGTATFFPGGGFNGSNSAFINNNASNHTGTITSAADLLTSPGGPTATIQADTTYTLTVAIGNRSGTGYDLDPGPVAIELLADNNGTLTPEATTALTAAQADAISDGTFQDFSASFTTGTTNSDLGDGLKVELVAEAATITNGYEPFFDDVRVDDMAIPEPMTWGMMFGGIAVLFGILRFRHKAI